MSSLRTAVLTSATAMATFVSAPHVARAQDAAPQEQSGYPRRTPDEVVATLDSKLSLTDDQKVKIKPIIEERQQKLRTLSDSGGRRMRKAREAKSIMKDSDKKIDAILNEEQRKKYAEIKDQMREEAKQRRQARNSQN